MAAAAATDEVEPPDALVRGMMYALADAEGSLAVLWRCKVLSAGGSVKQLNATSAGLRYSLARYTPSG